MKTQSRSITRTSSFFFFAIFSALVVSCSNDMKSITVPSPVPKNQSNPKSDGTDTGDQGSNNGDAASAGTSQGSDKGLEDSVKPIDVDLDKLDNPELKGKSDKEVGIFLLANRIEVLQEMKHSFENTPASASASQIVNLYARYTNNLKSLQKYHTNLSGKESAECKRFINAYDNLHKDMVETIQGLYYGSDKSPITQRSYQARLDITYRFLDNFHYLSYNGYDAGVSIGKTHKKSCFQGHRKDWEKAMKTTHDDASKMILAILGRPGLVQRANFNAQLAEDFRHTDKKDFIKKWVVIPAEIGASIVLWKVTAARLALLIGRSALTPTAAYFAYKGGMVSAGVIEYIAVQKLNNHVLPEDERVEIRKSMDNERDRLIVSANNFVELTKIAPKTYGEILSTLHNMQLQEFKNRRDSAELGYLELLKEYGSLDKGIKALKIKLEELKAEVKKSQPQAS